MASLFVSVLGLLAMSVNADAWDAIGSGSDPDPHHVNETLSCAARSIKDPVEFPSYLPPLFPFLMRCVLIMYYMSICFFGTALNLWMPYLVWKFKALRTLSFSFAVQISIINLFFALTLIFLSLVNAIAGRWLLGEGMCIATGFVHLTILVLRTTLMFVFVIDRFCLVFLPYFYPRHRDKVMYTLLPAAYLFSAACSAIAGIFDCYAFNPMAWLCRWKSICHAECAIVKPAIGIGVLTTFNFLSFVLYIALYCKAKRTGHSKTPAAHEIAIEGHDVKKEQRANITFFLLSLSLFVVTTLPGITLSAVVVFGPYDTVWYYLTETILLNILILYTITDPIFILRNKDVKEALGKLTWLPAFWYTCNA